MMIIEKKQQLQSILNAYNALCQKTISFKELLTWEQRYPEFANEIVALHSRLCIERLQRLQMHCVYNSNDDALSSAR